MVNIFVRKIYSLLLVIFGIAAVTTKSNAQTDTCNYVVTKRWLQAGPLAEHTTDVEYYDGLGCLTQTLFSHATPDCDVLVQPVEYDHMRRPDSKSLLPYISSGGSLDFRANSSQEQSSWYSENYDGDSCAYFSRHYESGLNGRPVMTMNPGEVYADSNKVTSISYDVNSISDHVLMIYFDESGYEPIPGELCIILEGEFSEGTLAKKTQVDEDGRIMTEFFDPLGRRMMTRVGSNELVADTYFVYDLRDRVVCVIPPEGSIRIIDSVDYGPDGISLDETLLRKYCFTWKYDSWDNVIESRIPGGPTNYFMYDNRDRCILSTDSEMHSKNIWKQTVYDDLNRVQYELYGTYREGIHAVNNPYVSLERSFWDEEGSSIPVDLAGRLAFVEDEVAGLADLCPALCKTLVSYERVYEAPVVARNSVVASGGYVDRSFYYDSKGRLIQKVEKGSDGWLDRYSTKYDFVGNVLAVRESHISPLAVEDVLISEFTYDQRGRVLSSVVRLNGARQHEVCYEYDEFGRPSGKSFYSLSDDSSCVARECVARNIQGWEKGRGQYIGSEEFFRQNLGYYDGVCGTPMYSGLISGVTYGRRGYMDCRYSYDYDGQGRLLGTERYEAGRGLVSVDVENGIEYDLNGNILSLVRCGHVENALPDSLVYLYDGNRLVGVEAFMDDCLYSYSWDENGRLTHDDRQGLDISYNVLNLPSVIENSCGMRTRYSYLSDGTKRDVSCDDGMWSVLYRGGFVYVMDDASNIALESVSTRDGRLMITEDEILDLWYAEDYLGNVRNVVSISDFPEVLEENDYLPYGTRIDDSSQPLWESNRWRYAGKEEHTSLTGEACRYIDFGARSYDPWTARWTTIDPLAGLSLNQSSFQYCSLNPINRIDPLGMVDYFNEDGHFLYKDGVDDGYMLIVPQKSYDELMSKHLEESDFNTQIFLASFFLEDSKESGRINIDALLSIAKHYNETGLPMNLLEGGDFLMSTNNSTKNKTLQIQVNITRCFDNMFFENYFNLINAINGHEGDHARRMMLDPWQYILDPRPLRELRACETQMRHESWPRTSPYFKKYFKKLYNKNKNELCGE